MERIAVFILVSLLIACGGGGGGGSAGPASVTEQDDPIVTEQDIQTGVFTDAPVAGLRFAQGDQEGVTNEVGEFVYDSNSSESVRFYVGDILLGGAQGNSEVTPYDLSLPGEPASLQSGFNISRFLISLDISEDDGIQLPSNIDLASGNVNFSLDSDSFEGNELVQRVVEFYRGGELVSVAETEEHLLLNDFVQADIANLRNPETSDLPSLELDWDTNLQQAGPLLKMESDNGEYLLVFIEPTSEASFDFHISEVFYVSPSGVYTAFQLDSNNVPTLVDVNGVISRYVNQSVGDFERFVQSVQTYDHERKGVLYDGSGQQGVDTSYIDPYRSVAIAELLKDFSTSEFTIEDRLHLVRYVLSLAENLRCAYSADSQCLTPSLQAVNFVLNDMELVSDFVSIRDQSIDLTSCVEFSNILNGLSQICESGVALQEVFVGFDSRFSEHANDVPVTTISRQLIFGVSLLPFHYFYSSYNGEMIGEYAELLICDAELKRVSIGPGQYYIKISSISGCYWWMTSECGHCIWDPETGLGELPYYLPGWDTIKSDAERTIQQVYKGYGQIVYDLGFHFHGIQYADHNIFEAVPYSDGDLYHIWYESYWNYIQPYLIESAENNSSRYVYRPEHIFDGDQVFERMGGNNPRLFIGLEDDLSFNLSSAFGLNIGNHSYLVSAILL